MKIKRFNESKITDCVKYYRLHIDASWEKFLIAIEKVGVSVEDFFGNWDITEFDDNIRDNQEYFKNDIIIFLIEKSDDGSEDYYVRNNIIDELRRSFGDTSKFIYGGDIFVEDYEITAKKYNI